MKKKIIISPLASLDLECQMRIRELRNEESIRKWMYSDHVISPNEHLSWIDGIKKDQSQAVFVVTTEDNEHVGVVSLNNIDKIHQKADWAYYLSEASRGGLGAAIEYFFIQFAFSSFGIYKLNCEVIEGNDAVVKLHKKFCFTQEGVKRSNIVKFGVRKNVYLLGLTKDEWDAGKVLVIEKYKKIFDKFYIVLDPGLMNMPVQDPIDLIQGARAKNNLNWMSILRLALEKAPETATPIVGEIRRIDREISTLTDVLLDGD